MRDPETGEITDDDVQPFEVGQATIAHIYDQHGTWEGYYTTSNMFTLTPGQIRNEALSDHERMHRQPSTWTGWARGTYHTHKEATR